MDSGKCHCGYGGSYETCCEPLVSGQSKARTAEQLMRSRYSAYVVGDEAHVLRTWHPDFRPEYRDFVEFPKWLSLVVERHEMGGPLDQTGTVEFIATFEGGVRHEVSRFSRWQGNWVYLDAID